jgi:hypothetical protein
MKTGKSQASGLRCPGLLMLLLILAANPGSVRPTLAANPKSVEQGRDVGDGQVRYDIPYDPKHVSAITFVSPTVQHPFFEIVVPMGDWTEGKSATVQKVRVNGVDSESFYLFVDGFSRVQSGWITQKSPTAKNVALVTRSIWHNGESVAIEVEVSAAGDGDTSRTIKKSYTARAPATGGGPEGWRRYQSVVLSEHAGLARDHEPVEFSLTVRAEDCADLERELRLYGWDSHSHRLTPLPVQTFNAREFGGTPPGTIPPARWRGSSWRRCPRTAPKCIFSYMTTPPPQRPSRQRLTWPSADRHSARRWRTSFTWSGLIPNAARSPRSISRGARKSLSLA